jgi:hypothetical protein
MSRPSIVTRGPDFKEARDTAQERAFAAPAQAIYACLSTGGYLEAHAAPDELAAAARIG